MKRFELNSGDLIMSCSGTMGKIAIVPENIKKGIINQALLKLSPSKKVSTVFLKLWMQSESFQDSLKEYSGGAAIQNVASVAILKQIEIPLPPLPEQQRIVAILDEAFAAIAKAKANTEQNLKNAKELFESYLQSVFENKGEGWEEKTIGEMCDLMTGGTPSSSKPEYYEGGKIKWLVSGDVNMIEINDCEGRITELGMANSNTKYLPLNSIIIALNGQGKTRGTVAMLKTQATCNQSLVSICPKNIKKIISDYIFYNLKVRYQEIRKITGDSGNDRRGLNMPLIRSIRISFPESIVEQDKYVKQFSFLLNETKRLEAIYRRKIGDLEELKKSVLDKAFKGEL
jgi:type I restriction enzyme S subunit